MCLIWLLQCTLLGCIVTKLHTYIFQKKSTSLCSTGPFSASPSNITIPVWLIWPLYLKQRSWPPLTPTFWSLYPLHILQSMSAADTAYTCSQCSLCALCLLFKEWVYQLCSLLWPLHDLKTQKRSQCSSIGNMGVYL